MTSFNSDSILETINMIRVHHLDIRTVTLALSLRDCCNTDVKAVGEKIYNKITKYAKNLTTMAQEIEDEYSIPIINKTCMFPHVETSHCGVSAIPSDSGIETPQCDVST